MLTQKIHKKFGFQSNENIFAIFILIQYKDFTKWKTFLGVIGTLIYLKNALYGLQKILLDKFTWNFYIWCAIVNDACMQKIKIGHRANFRAKYKCFPQILFLVRAILRSVTVQPKNNACARTSFCVRKKKFFLRLIAGRLSLSPGNRKNFFVAAW